MIGCLIIHGYTGGPYELDPLVAYLTEKTDWDIHVPTLPGHGKKLELKNVSHEEWLEAAENEMKELNEKYDTIYVIGFSMGGMIAAYLAGKYNVSKLVLLATAGKYLSFKQIAIDTSGVVSDLVKGKLNDNLTYNHYKKKLGHIPFKANVEFLKLVRFTRSYLNKITAPVFIAQGQQDGMVPTRAATYLDKEIVSEEKKVVLFDQSKHLICLGEDKDTLNEMIGDFLEIKK